MLWIRRAFPLIKRFARVAIFVGPIAYRFWNNRKTSRLPRESGSSTA
jgi:hypothetical protein